MKIKAGLMQGANLEPKPRGDPGHGPRGDAGPPGPRGDQGPTSRGPGDRNLPGENLPEHHFKKKYFNQVMTADIHYVNTYFNIDLINIEQMIDYFYYK